MLSIIRRKMLGKSGGSQGHSRHLALRREKDEQTDYNHVLQIDMSQISDNIVAL